MNRVSGTLAQLENRLQALVENSSAWLFPMASSSRQLAMLLESALRTGLHEGDAGEEIAPNMFYLLVHPEHASLLQQDFAWIDGLEKSLLEIGEGAGFVFASAPIVRIVASQDLEIGEMRVIAETNIEPISETAGKKYDQEGDSEEISINGFLIVNGTEIFELNKPVINIGRRSDNQLVLDDGRVSRLHAQLRIINQSFVIFDLDSSGGTWVNGERVSQHKLVPGDVISLAGLPIVFGQEADDHGNTQDVKLDRFEEKSNK